MSHACTTFPLTLDLLSLFNFRRRHSRLEGNTAGSTTSAMRRLFENKAPPSTEAELTSRSMSIGAQAATPLSRNLHIASTSSKANSSWRSTRSITLSSGVPLIDSQLGGGLPANGLSEWGLPTELAGRYIILSFLASLHRAAANLARRVLWVNRPFEFANENARPWALRGIDLSQVHFAQVAHPFQDLAPVFQRSDFRLIVLDSFPAFSREQVDFLSHYCRRFRVALFFLNDRPLTEDSGNVWVKRRWNCWYDSTAGQYRLRLVRGRNGQGATGKYVF